MEELDKPEITLSTPFADKDYCFKEHVKGIKNLNYDKDKIFYLVYDNSNSDSFNRKLKKFAKRNFKYHRIYVDDTPHKVIENSDDYGKITERITTVYNKIRELALEEESREYIFNVEDDVVVPPDTINKLLEVFNSHDKIATAVGDQKTRRQEDTQAGQYVSLVWRFEKKGSYPRNMETGRLRLDPKYIAEKPFGIEMIGAAHMGCWMSKTEVLKQLDFTPIGRKDTPNPSDLTWGYKLMENGWYIAIDWSIKCKHYWKVDGEKGYY